MTTPTDALNDAAQTYAAKYADDDRQDIRVDVFNAFCAGAKWGQPQAGASGEPVGKCCYGGSKPKSACASCAAWAPPPQAVRELTEEACEINTQVPRLNHALSETHGDVCIIYVDFGCKRFNVSGAGSADEVPTVSIDPCEPSQGWECADISFPNRSGWDVVSASSSKYTLTAVLKRGKHGITKGGQHGAE